jgi:hypothetical protein
VKYDNVPWAEVKKWKMNCWYPLPLSSLWCDSISVVDRWGIFTQDLDCPEDCISILDEHFTFKQAIAICEAKNGWSFKL